MEFLQDVRFVFKHSILSESSCTSWFRLQVNRSFVSSSSIYIFISSHMERETNRDKRLFLFIRFELLLTLSAFFSPAFFIQCSLQEIH